MDSDDENRLRAKWGLIPEAKERPMLPTNKPFKGPPIRIKVQRRDIGPDGFARRYILIPVDRDGKDGEPQEYLPDEAKRKCEEYARYHIPLVVSRGGKFER
ncbi:hypothetical protein [Gellertiella hungarica]|uniref:Uncharacterized protein n=1 Tax=Gellertiella hungarica TaxID=1572859 RepID=A0A7W6J6C0_9HYPH|nr:hypothetical protein [Gellertiella hungarica]MBB4064743.1 hypothetical protein [Gellertiella hungarica]